MNKGRIEAAGLSYFAISANYVVGSRCGVHFNEEWVVHMLQNNNKGTG